MIDSSSGRFECKLEGVILHLMVGCEDLQAPKTAALTSSAHSASLSEGWTGL